MENDPNEEEFLNALTELMDQVFDLPTAGMEQLAGWQESRLGRLQMVEDRLAAELPEEDIRLRKVRHSIQRSATLQALAKTRAERDAIRPKIRPHQSAFVGTVRRKNGKPLAGGRVELVQRKANNEDKFISDAVINPSGDFAIVIPGQRFTDDAGEKGSNLVLRVLNKAGKLRMETKESIRARPGRVELFDIALSTDKLL